MERIVGHPEPAGRKQILFVAVVLKRARLPHQAPNDVAVIDAVIGFGISEAPHGGVKCSGIGRTHGKLGLEEMCWKRAVPR